MIVCNAAPLIAFARIQRRDLLHEVVGNIVIPDEVVNELSRCRHRPYGEISLERESSIIDQQVQS